MIFYLFTLLYLFYQFDAPYISFAENDSDFFLFRILTREQYELQLCRLGGGARDSSSSKVPVPVGAVHTFRPFYQPSRAPVTPKPTSLSNRATDLHGSQYHCAAVQGNHQVFLIADAAHRDDRPLLFSAPVPRPVALCFAPLKDLDCATFVAVSVLLRSFSDDVTDWFLKHDLDGTMHLPLTTEIQKILRLLHGTSDFGAGGPFINIEAVQSALLGYRDIKQGKHDGRTGQDPVDLWEAMCSVLHEESDLQATAIEEGKRCCVTEHGSRTGCADHYCVGERFLSLLGLKGHCSIAGCTHPVIPGLGLEFSSWSSFDDSDEQNVILQQIRLLPQSQISDPSVLIYGNTRAISLVVRRDGGSLCYAVVHLFIFILLPTAKVCLDS